VCLFSMASNFLRLEYQCISTYRAVVIRQQHARARLRSLIHAYMDTCIHTGLWSFGSNTLGQLGRETHGTEDSHAGLVELHTDAHTVVSMACGDEHSLCAVSDGSLWAWGKGTQAALGLGGEMRNQGVPKPVRALQGRRVCTVSCGVSSAVVCSTGMSMHYTDADYSTRGVSSGVCAHSLFTWGSNRSAELAHGDLLKRTVPRHVKAPRTSGIYAISMGVEHCVAICEWTQKPTGVCLYLCIEQVFRCARVYAYMHL
jgi:alpha-tubulin suppressor-like RCC1 family protein